ncbi:MAG: hypothetical protein ACTSPD_10495 [Promethearchaeota archaeon]
MSCFDKLFNEKSITILIYVAKETVDDPYEKNVTLQDLPPYPVKALFIQDYDAEQAKWKMPGIEITKGKEYYIPAKYKELLKMSSKIEIDGDYYYGWRDNAGKKLTIKDQADGEYILVRFWTK